MAVVLRKYRSKDLDRFGILRRVMFPIEMHAGHPDHGHEVELRIGLANAVMRARAKDKPILRLLFSGSRYPSIWVKIVGIRICFWVMKCWIRRRNYHAT